MLHRRIGLLQAVSLNMGMMVGVGPFITIPLFVATLGGPQAMVGWVLGALVAIADGQVWSELAAAHPGSGGTYHFYDAVYGRSPLGRVLKFLFVWQFLFSGPLELASGALGLAQYGGFLFPGLKEAAWSVALPWTGSGGSQAVWVVTNGQLAGMAAMAGIVALAYRRIEVAGAVMVVLWAGVIFTVGWMVVAGLTAFDAKQAFAFPPDAWTLDSKFGFGLGAALGIAMYDLFGYYQVCYLGDEVIEPEKTIPRAILIAVLAISSIYLLMNIGILGVLPAADVMASQHIASDFMVVRYGPWAGTIITWLILWCGSTAMFAGLLSYSRVPYAAAKAGHFFGALAATHPKGDFPHRSLLLVGAISVAACLFDLPTVIGALIASRIWIQFLGQIVTVARMRQSGAAMPYRMPLYPLPALVAGVGWLYVFFTLQPEVQVYGALSLVVGLGAFVLWRALGSRLVGDASA